jgi:two-component system invasion response regulator UvrY
MLWGLPSQPAFVVWKGSKARRRKESWHCDHRLVTGMMMRKRRLASAAGVVGAVQRKSEVKVKILLVDDHPIVRAGLRRLLTSAAICEIYEAATARDGLALFREHRPDVVVLDLNLPGGIGGLELLRRLALEEGAGTAAARVLVFSMHTDAIYAARALQGGARGYITKNAAPDDIVQATKRVAAGGTYLAHEIAQELAMRSVAGETHPLQQLSGRDLDILRLLGEGRSLAEIAAALGISYKTVANACTQLKGKLAVARTSDLVRVALEMSLL